MNKYWNEPRRKMLRTNWDSFHNAKLQWDCITDTRFYVQDVHKKRLILEENISRRAWTYVLQCMEFDAELTNTTRLNGPLRQSPLHVAAETGAPLAVVQEMLEYGAWRLLRDANGKRPLDLAWENGHKHLYSVLVPIYEWKIPLPRLLKIQRNFHRLILDMEEKLVMKLKLRLPLLEPLLEFRNEYEVPFHQFALIIPGSHGWIRYWLEAKNGTPYLSVESYCRLVTGSEMLHRVTTDGFQLVKRGNKLQGQGDEGGS